ncbi:ABC transporter permease [Kitasatospora kazusensis]|uniref:ABC transporter permease n=1 Tax=Kitasatospora kazusensis TaxID=407974 RepID=UPI0031D43B52
MLGNLWIRHRVTWRSTFISSVLQPTLYLLALGLTLGAHIRPGPNTWGQPYAVYLVPGILVTRAVQNAVGESTYPLLDGFRWTRTYWAAVSSPLEPVDLLNGQVLWVAVQVLESAVAFLVIAAVFGVVTGPGVVLSLFFAMLTGLAVAVPVMAFVASLEREGPWFTVLSRFVILPMTLAAGTYFPVSQLPGWLQPVAWVTPVWHGNELAREAAFGGLNVATLSVHTGYLLLFLAAGYAMARRRFTRRLRF